MENRKQPDIRFSGFEKDWEETSIGKISNVIDPHPSHRAPIAVNEGIPFIGIGDVNEVGNINYKNVRVVDEKIYDEHHSRYDLSIPSIGIGRVASLGKVIRLRNDIGKYAVSPTMSVIQFNEEYDLDFLYSFMNSPEFQNQFKSYSNGSTRQSVGIQDLRKLILNLPCSNDEQKKIGRIFKDIDNFIISHQQELATLKQTKQGFLQKMFPKEGEKVPEVRFPEFTDEWEQRKLSDVIEKLSGGASIKPTDYLEDGIRTIPKGAVNATGIADLSGSKYISEDFFKNNITSHVHTNSLVTSLRDLVPSAPNMGRIVRIEGDDEQFLMPQGVYKLELFKGMDEDFLISFSNSDKYRKIISAEKNGSTQVHIRNGEFLNIDINLPSEHEQKKIGTFFHQLDQTIALHQRELELLQLTKKAFLQKLFV